MAKPEQVLHRAVADYLAVSLTDETFFTTFPAGGGGRIRGAILKSLGLASGVPDLLLIHAGRACWIELKAKGGRLSEAQGECHVRLMAAESPVVIARSIDDVEKALQGWSIPLRANVRRAA